MVETTNTVSSNYSFIEYKEVKLTLKSHLILFVMRLAYKSILSFILRSKHSTIVWFQLRIASMTLPAIDGVPIKYDIIGKSPGDVFGKLDDVSLPVVLWLHGGAFVLPASPNAHHPMVGKLCQQLGANGFMPDYRLAPLNPFPAGLNDCVKAYRELLNLGYSSSQIVLGGDSAGANFVFGLLQRIRESELPMPACAIAVSPIADMGRVHGPPSRPANRKLDALIPVSALLSVWDIYCAGNDSADPEISPLYIDCAGLPPVFIVAGAHEILRDDSIMLAKRLHAAGIITTCHIWAMLPHAFPLFSNILVEARKSCDDIASFASAHLASGKR